MLGQRKHTSCTAADAIIEFLNNDRSDKPPRAAMIGCGGAGKSHTGNMIVVRVNHLTDNSNAVQMTASAGTAAFGANQQGSTLHSLFCLELSRLENYPPCIIATETIKVRKNYYSRLNYHCKTSCHRH
jgi:hypothetical protein